MNQPATELHDYTQYSYPYLDGRKEDTIRIPAPNMQHRQHGKDKMCHYRGPNAQESKTRADLVSEVFTIR